MDKSIQILSERLRINFFKVLKRKVRESNIDQKQLAYELGIDPSNLSRILNGRYSCGIDTLLAICARLNIWLTFYSNE